MSGIGLQTAFQLHHFIRYKSVLKQAEAFLLIAQGKTRAEASYAMGIKEGSFGDYTKAIYSMFDFHSKKELIEYSRRVLASGKAPKPKAKKSRR